MPSHNFILETEALDSKSDLIPLLFGDDKVVEPTVFLPCKSSVIDVLIAAGIFPSKGEARRNWKREIDIPNGLTEIPRVGKAKKSIWVWKP